MVKIGTGMEVGMLAIILPLIGAFMQAQAHAAVPADIAQSGNVATYTGPICASVAEVHDLLDHLGEIANAQYTPIGRCFQASQIPVQRRLVTPVELYNGPYGSAVILQIQFESEKINVGFGIDKWVLSGH